MPTMQLRELLPLGLRRDAGDPANAGFAELKYWKPNVKGLIAMDAITNPYSAGAGPTFDADAYPFPQFLAGTSYYAYLGKVSSALRLVKCTFNGTTYAYSAALSTTATLPTTNGAGTMRTMAVANNFGIIRHENIFFLFSASGFLTNAPVYPDLGSNYATSDGWAFGAAATESFPLSVTIDAQGRIVFGGISVYSTDFSSGDRYDIWQILRKHNRGTIVTDESIPNNRLLFWGAKGGAEADIPFTAELSLFCGVKVDVYKHILMGMARAGELGFTYIPWEGSINEVHRLGDDLVIYGSAGVGIATWDGQGYVPRKVLDIGTNALGDVCANINQHVFLDRTGVLWTIEAGKGFERLGYSEYLSTFPGSCHFSYDKLSDDYYIQKSDGTTYILANTQGGQYKYALATSRYTPWCIIAGAATRLGAIGTTANFVPYFKTGRLDMDSRSVKTLDYVELGKETFDTNLHKVTATISFRAGGTTYKTPTGVDFNDAGIADIVRSGIDFQVQVGMTAGDTERLTFFNLIFREEGEKKGVAGYLA